MDTVRRYSMLIGGAWVDTDERFDIRSPATEEIDRRAYPRRRRGRGRGLPAPPAGDPGAGPGVTRE